jgi:hypothetical protein
MQVDSPSLVFPASFCCNCGDTNCMNEIQDTRRTRYFGIGGTETTFHLPIPVCAGCRRTTRRRPSVLFAKILVLGLAVCGMFLAVLALAASAELPSWIGDHLFAISVALGVIFTFIFYRLRRPKPPRTSFYQPVRIKEASVQFTDVMSGPGQVIFMKLAFTNPDYLNLFVIANRAAIDAGRVSVVRA